MKFKKIVVCGLALMSMLAIGCAKKSDTNLGETKLTIPTYTIKAPAKGKILGLILEKGEHIGKDQPLFAIASDDVDAAVKLSAEELAKAEAELKRLEIGSSVQVSAGELASAQERVAKAEANASKMNRLLAAGAVSRKQAQQAEAELASARAGLNALSGQSEKQKASPEAIAKQKEIVEASKANNTKALEKQAAFEALAPNSCVVTEKLAKNGDEVEKDQPVLKLLAQDECEIQIKISSKAVEKLGDKNANLVFKEKGGELSFTGKVVRLEDDKLTALIKLPAGVKRDISVEINIQE